LLWIVEHTIALGPELDSALEDAIGNDLFRVDDLPKPADEERKPPA
jgi:hypothetical protein